MSTDKLLDTHQKALSINLDDSIYGSLVEIGAGQDAAAHFFRSGGASGTIAKTMSAYDMKVSDEIYGKASRYVSRERLTTIVDREYSLLEERLKELRGEKSRFFSFANTVSARNYQGTNICHGWMGIRFQTAPRSQTNQVIIHVNMRDETNLLQQQALGILGINLIYASYHYLDNLEHFLDSLLDSLRIERMEVDFIHLEGPAFEEVDNISMNLNLVKQGLCHAVMFTPNKREAAPPLDLLYKCPIVVERGLFRFDHPVYLKILEKSLDFLRSEGQLNREPVSFFEMTIKNVDEHQNHVSKDCTLKLMKLGYPVMVSSFAETYKLTGYLGRYTSESLRFSQGIGNLIQVMQERFYENLDSGILSAMSQLFAKDVKLYVFGMEVEALKEQMETDRFDLSYWDIPKEGIANLHNISPRGHMRHLYAYLLEKGALLDIPFS